MNLDEKPQFMKLLSTLFGAHGKPLSEGMIAGYWKGLEKMSLVAFERCVDVAIERLSHAERGIAKTPTVAELWDIKRGANRHHTAVQQEQEKPYSGDHWDIAANHLLLAYISKNFLKPQGQRIDYAPDINGPHTEAIAKILRKWAKAWSQDMREDRAEGGKLDGKPNWFHCMSEADKEVVRYLSQMKVAA